MRRTRYLPEPGKRSWRDMDSSRDGTSSESSPAWNSPEFAELMKRLFAAKESRRAALARLPIEEKSASLSNYRRLPTRYAPQQENPHRNHGNSHNRDKQMQLSPVISRDVSRPARPSLPVGRPRGWRKQKTK